MPSDLWGWIGFIIVAGTGIVCIGAALMYGLWYYWVDRFEIFLTNRNEYMKFVHWRQEQGIKTPYDEENPNNHVLDTVRFSEKRTWQNFLKLLENQP